jgi:nucleotide-binding universal stress UspA family protein
MTIRTLLASIDGSAGDRRTLDAALGVAQLDRGCITALYADTDPRDVPAAYVGDGSGVYLTQEMWDSLEAEIAERRSTAQKHFDDWKAKAGLPEPGAGTDGPTAQLLIEIGTRPTLLLKHGTLADLIVVALPKDGEPGQGAALEAALFDTGRPVLAVPLEARGVIEPSAPVLIAWNGRAEAARAIAAALPILARTRGAIFLVNVGKRDAPESLAPAIRYLAAHGISAEGLTLIDRPGETGALLLGEAEQRGAGLLVMGAYTHSRLRQMVLGGVTRHIIHHAKLPVLFAH